MGDFSRETFTKDFFRSNFTWESLVTHRETIVNDSQVVIRSEHSILFFQTWTKIVYPGQWKQTEGPGPTI